MAVRINTSTRRSRASCASPNAPAQERAKLLAPRESKVFALVVMGMLNKQIACGLGVGEKTVKVHRARVMEI